MRHFHYLINGALIRITNKRRPTLKGCPRTGTWVVREFTKGVWLMPAFPEITWGILKRGEYLGAIKAEQLNATPDAE